MITVWSASAPPPRWLASLKNDLPETQRRQVRAAFSELMDSMKSRPDDMASHYNLGNFHMARGEMPEAVAEFEAATRLQPEALPPYVDAALAYSALGQNDKAEASLRRALCLDPTNAVANLNLGMLLAEIGKLSEAEQSFRAAFKSDPQSAQAAFNLGVLLAKEHPDESLIWCRRAAELRPQEAKYAYTLAFFQKTAGEDKRSCADVGKAGSAVTGPRRFLRAAGADLRGAKKNRAGAVRLSPGRRK